MTSLAVHRGQTPVQNKGNAKIYVDETFLRFSTTVIMIHGSFDNTNTRGFRSSRERLLRTTKSTIRKLLQKTTWGKIKFKLLFFRVSILIFSIFPSSIKIYRRCFPFYAQMRMMMMSQWLLFRTTAFFSSDYIIFYTTWGSTFNCGKKTLVELKRKL